MWALASWWNSMLCLLGWSTLHKPIYLKTARKLSQTQTEKIFVMLHRKGWAISPNDGPSLPWIACLSLTAVLFVIYCVPLAVHCLSSIGLSLATLALSLQHICLQHCTVFDNGSIAAFPPVSLEHSTTGMNAFRHFRHFRHCFNLVSFIHLIWPKVEYFFNKKKK